MNLSYRVEWKKKYRKILQEKGDEFLGAYFMWCEATEEMITQAAEMMKEAGVL